MLRTLPGMFALWLMLFAVAPFVPLLVVAGLVIAVFFGLTAVTLASELRFVHAWRRAQPTEQRRGPTSRMGRWTYGLSGRQRRRLLRQRQEDEHVDRLRRDAIRWANLHVGFILGMVLAGAVWLLVALG